MTKIRFGLIAFASILIIVQLILIDYNDFSWSNNSSNYLLTISMTCIIIAMIFSNKHEKKKI